MKKLFAVLFVCITLNCFAVVRAVSSGATISEVIGFSKDGNYFAFERYGTYDGSGFPHSEIFILAVDTNDYAAKPISLTLEDSETGEDVVRAKNLAVAGPMLAKFGIVKGHKGTRVYSGRQNDTTVVFQYQKKKVEILLQESETHNEDCEMQGTNEMKMTLSMRYQGTTKVLQQDAKVPRSRACAYNYTVIEVYQYNAKVVAFVSFMTPGFEGPDTQQIAVSGFVN